MAEALRATPAAHGPERTARPWRMSTPRRLRRTTSPGLLVRIACPTPSANAVGAVRGRAGRVRGARVGRRAAPDGDQLAAHRLRADPGYVAFRFSARFAPGAIVALVHDVGITAGIFVIFGPRVRPAGAGRAAGDPRLQPERHDHHLRPHPREHGAAHQARPRRRAQPQRQPDALADGADLGHHHGRGARAALPGRRGAAPLRHRHGHRHRGRDLLVGLHRRPNAALAREPLRRTSEGGGRGRASFRGDVPASSTGPVGGRSCKMQANVGT